MKNILREFESHISSIEGAMDELFPPTTSRELDIAEQELGIIFPEDFRTLYQWRNGDRGNLFLFGEYRISPLSQILELYRFSQNAPSSDMKHASDDSGVLKDCISNTKWIQFADNGGNTVVLLDMDPGKQGIPGQLIEACDGDTECRFSGVKEFFADITNRISTGQIEWDNGSACFWETDDESVPEREAFEDKINIVESAPSYEALRQLNAGDEATLVGAIKPNHKTKKHQLYIRNGSILVVGDIGNIGGGLSHGPPLVKVKVRVGKQTLFGFGTPAYEVISCERVPQ